MGAPSPAALALLQRGITIQRVADTAGRSRPNVSQMMIGKIRLSGDVRSAIVDLSGGDEAFARQVSALAHDAFEASRGR